MAFMKEKNWTSEESFHTMLKVARLSNSFWAKALQMLICYLQNCSYISILNKTIPYEL